MDIRNKKAVWYPIFSNYFLTVFIYGFMFVIALTGLFLPDISYGDFSRFLKSIVTGVADINYRILQSRFPFVTAVVYLQVLFLSPLCAVLLCFTNINMKVVRGISSDSFFKNFLIIVFLIIVYLIPFFVVLDQGGNKNSKGIMANYKPIFLLFMEGLFLFYTMSWFFVLDEFTRLINKLVRK